MHYDECEHEKKIIMNKFAFKQTRTSKLSSVSHIPNFDSINSAFEKRKQFFAMEMLLISALLLSPLALMIWYKLGALGVG